MSKQGTCTRESRLRPRTPLCGWSKVSQKTCILAIVKRTRRDATVFFKFAFLEDLHY